MPQFLDEVATIHAILDAGFIAHLGFSLKGQSFVMPTLFGREGDSLYLHGSAARMLEEVDEGVRACVTVTLVDGLVLTRSTIHPFLNYRSVLALGTARRIDEPVKKARALRVISEQLIQGRWQDARRPCEKELKATPVLEFPMEEVSARTREGFPVDEPEDHASPVWRGIVPLSLTAGRPVPDPRMAGRDCVPEYLRRYLTQRNGGERTGDASDSFSLAWHGLA